MGPNAQQCHSISAMAFRGVGRTGWQTGVCGRVLAKMCQGCVRVASGLCGRAEQVDQAVNPLAVVLRPHDVHVVVEGMTEPLHPLGVYRLCHFPGPIVDLLPAAPGALQHGCRIPRCRPMAVCWSATNSTQRKRSSGGQGLGERSADGENNSGTNTSLCPGIRRPSGRCSSSDPEVVYERQEAKARGHRQEAKGKRLRRDATEATEATARAYQHGWHVEGQLQTGVGVVG